VHYYALREEKERGYENAQYQNHADAHVWDDVSHTAFGVANAAKITAKQVTPCLATRGRAFFINRHKKGLL